MGKKVAVLVVDDSPICQQLISDALRKDPELEIVATAANGREAVDLCKTLKPNVITMDVDMPVMDGRLAMSALRSDPRTFKTPIIVLTAHASPEDVAAAIEAGCYSYETKPVVMRRLLERIEEALQPVAK